MRRRRTKKKIAKIEARIIRISQGKYRLKVWNSGNATAYNVKVDIPQEYNIMVMKDKIPYEYLEPGSNFEEYVVIHGGSAPKFKIISTWEDEKANKHENVQLRSI